VSNDVTSLTCPQAPYGQTHHLIPSRGGSMTCQYCHRGRGDLAGCQHTLTTWVIGELGPMTNDGAKITRWDKACSWCGEILEQAATKPKENA
jgi:hypothetical protein